MSGDEQDLVDYDEENEEEREEPTKRTELKAKGRGHRDTKRHDSDRGGAYEAVTDDGKGGLAAQSVEGWVIVVTNVHEEAQVGGDELLMVCRLVITHRKRYVAAGG